MKSHEEWLHARTHSIGGSDASSIVGMNPYMTNVELWEIKTGRTIQEDISEKPYVKYGTEAESHLRELFKLDFPCYEVKYEADTILVDSRYPHFHASLDGELLDEETCRRGILEIKTTNILQSMQREKWKERIPDNYYIQVLHYLMVTGYDFAVLKAQLKSEYEDLPYLQTKHYKIEREDVLEDIEYLRNAELEFWKCVEEDRKPNLILPEI